MIIYSHMNIISKYLVVFSGGIAKYFAGMSCTDASSNSDTDRPFGHTNNADENRFALLCGVTSFLYESYIKGRISVNFTSAPAVCGCGSI